MRIEQLRLIAFGPFSGQELCFPQACPDLHLVYGDNEAGKSSALRAMATLFFGFGPRKAEDFVHRADDLRVGAVLANGGEPLSLVRRRGRLKTLRTADDREPLPDEVLPEALGNIGLEEFQTWMGFGRAQLVSGGESICSSTGELSRILFSAATGAVNWTAAQRELAAEIEALWRPRGGSAISETLKQRKEKEREAKQTAIDPEAAWAHEQSLREARQRCEELGREIARLTTQREQLERLRQGRPSVLEWRELVRTIAASPGVMLLDEAFQKRYAQAAHDLRHAQAGLAESDAAIAEIQARRDALAINEPAVGAEHAAVNELLERRGACRKAVEALAGLRTEHAQSLNQVGAALARLRPAVELGPELDLSAAEALRLPKPLRERIEQLAAQRESLEGRRSALEQAAGQAADQLATSRRQLEKLPAPVEATALRLTVEAARQEGALDQQARKLTSELAVLAGAVTAELTALRPAMPPGTPLSELPLPEDVVVARFERDFAECREQEKLAAGQLKQARKALLQAEASVTEAQLAGPVPSREAVLEARARRDLGWGLIRQAWLGQIADPQAVEAFVALSKAVGLPEAYESAVAAADLLADQLAAEADRSTRCAKLRLDIQTHTAEASRLQDELADLTGTQADLAARWAAVWAETGVAPRSPAEMGTWMAKVGQLRTRQDGLGKQEQDLAILRGVIGRRRRELADALAALGTALPAGDELAPALDLGKQVLADLDAREKNRQSLEQAIQLLAERAERDQAKLSDLQAQLAAWKGEWVGALKATALPAEASTTEARAALECLSELSAALDAVGHCARQIERQQILKDAFEADVRRLAQTICPTVQGSPVEQAAELVHRCTQFDSFSEKLEAARADRRKLERRIREAVTELGLLSEQAGCTSPAELPAAIAHSAQRRADCLRRDQLHRDLAALCGGEVDGFAAQAEAARPAELDAQIAELGQRLQGLVVERDAANQAIGKEDRDLRALQQESHKAADAAQEAEQALARIADDAREYARLQACKLLLERAMDRYRRENQNPVLAAAGEYFSRLTGGAFSGLDTDYEGDQQVLLAIGQGRRIKANQMSEGTCDQLYLALRLGHLAHRLESGATPFPLILDDILVNFDDARATATLAALAEVATRTQVILFTHHRHVVQLAKQAIGEQLNVLTLAGR